MRLLLAAALLFVLPTAAASITIEPGVSFETPNTTLTFAENTTTADDVRFAVTTGALTIDGYTPHFQPAEGEHWSWDILDWSFPSRFSIRGNTTTAGRLDVHGLNGLFDVTGVNGFPAFQVGSSEHNFSLPPGNQTVTMEIAGSGPVEIEWALLDTWWPIIFWGFLFGLFLYHSAWAPAIGSLMALLVALMPTPMWNTTASVMIVAALLVLHKIAANGILPSPWGKTR